jgi:amino acid permease
MMKREKEKLCRNATLYDSLRYPFSVLFFFYSLCFLRTHSFAVFTDSWWVVAEFAQVSSRKGTLNFFSTLKLYTKYKIKRTQHIQHIKKEREKEREREREKRQKNYKKESEHKLIPGTCSTCMTFDILCLIFDDWIELISE